MVKDKEKSRTIPDTVKYKAAEMLADPTIKTKKEIHESLPISEATLYSWLKEQEFIDMVNEKGEDRTLTHYYPKTILKFSNANHKNKKHPTQKPVELFEYLIKTYTNDSSFSRLLLYLKAAAPG